MENSTQTTIILRSLDLELKALLKKDLKNFRSVQSKNNLAGKQLLAA